jgi:hypothetical protein
LLEGAFPSLRSPGFGSPGEAFLIPCAAAVLLVEVAEIAAHISASLLRLQFAFFVVENFPHLVLPDYMLTAVRDAETEDTVADLWFRSLWFCPRMMHNITLILLANGLSDFKKKCA